MNAFVVLLTCLIVLPVLVSNDQFLLEVFATGGADTEEETDDSETVSGGGETGETGDSGGKTDDLETESEGGSDSDPGDLAQPAQPPPSADMADPSVGDTESEGSNPNGDSGDDDGNGDRFRHNAQEIAMELASLSPEELREYPITDLSDKDITLVFRFLNQGDLAKVLLNIQQDFLVEIKDRLTPAAFGEPLNRISEADRTQVVNRLMLTSTN